MQILTSLLAAGAGDSEGTFWTVILTIVLLCCGAGIWSVAKRRKVEKDWQLEETLYPSDVQGKQVQSKKTAFEIISPEGELKADPAAPQQLHTGEASKVYQKKISDLNSGLELLDLNFLARLVSNTDNADQSGIEIRKIAFSELARREKLGSIEGKVLKVYATNLKNLFGKFIQCRAIAELAGRTKNSIQTPSAKT